MKAAVGKMIGSLAGGFWAQVHDYVPDDVEKSAKMGRLVAAVSVDLGEDSDQVELVKMGREILGRLHELYFGGLEATPLEALRSAIQKVEDEFGRVDIASLVITDNYIYVGTGGNGGVWANSGNKFGFLSRPNEEGQVQVLSGMKKPAMCFVVGNGQLWKSLSDQDLVTMSIIAGADMEEAVETMTTKAGEGGAGKVAALVYMPVAAEKPTGMILPDKVPGQINTQPEWLIKIKEKWTDYWQRVYVYRGDKEQQRKKMRFVGMGFLLLLFVMVGGGQLLGKNKSVEQKLGEEQVDQLVADFKDASGMVEINPKRSKELLEQMQGQLEEYRTGAKTNDRVTAILTEWDDVWMKASGITKPELTELINLSLVREGVAAGGMDLSDAKLYVLDTQGSRVIEVNLSKGSGDVVGGGVVGGKLIAGYPGKVFILAEKGIIQLGSAEAKIERDDAWGSITRVRVFGGNIYMLDSGAGEVWRYGVAGSGYGDKQKWLTADENRESIKQASGMAIDGSIWIVTPSGVDKYTRGVKDAFEITDLESMWGNGAKIYTSDETEDLYILDPDNSRVVILSKEGKYKKQFVSELWKGAVDLVADEKEGKMFVLGSDKVWAVKL
jgi:hypothetical protein